MAGAPALAAAVSVAGWTVTDALERENAFCVSCHLPDGVPLHRENKGDFDARPPVSLAVAHAAAGNETHADRAFRCIDCHGGVGFVGRARVKLLSAKDAFWYAVRRFDEPSGMHWPLRDADCTQCHDGFDEAVETAGTLETGGAIGSEAGEFGDYGESGAEGATRDPDYHEVPVHNAESPVRCVDCHGSHEPGGLADRGFLIPGIVRAECARCHEEFEEGM